MRSRERKNQDEPGTRFQQTGVLFCHFICLTGTETSAHDGQWRQMKGDEKRELMNSSSEIGPGRLSYPRRLFNKTQNANFRDEGVR
jgi:hypothetical protein